MNIPLKQKKNVVSVVPYKFWKKRQTPTAHTLFTPYHNAVNSEYILHVVALQLNILPVSLLRTNRWSILVSALLLIYFMESWIRLSLYIAPTSACKYPTVLPFWYKGRCSAYKHIYGATAILFWPFPTYTHQHSCHINCSVRHEVGGRFCR